MSTITNGDPVARLLGDLTGEQERAVVTPARTVCVLAAAGAGKTRVLTRRIAYRLATASASADHVLAITFTRKAAGELRERLAAAGADRVAAGTFHALAWAQLRRYWADRRTPAPTLLASKIRLLAEIVPSRPALRDVPLADVASHIEWAKARAVAPHELASTAAQMGRVLPCDVDALAGAYARYEDEKARRRLVDFDDLLSRYAAALEQDARFAAAQRWRWQHLFVDELQDVNPLQCRLLEAVLGDNDDLFVVGDPNQAIYGWNGADPDFLLGFPSRWPEAEVVELSSNHRSTPQIVTAAASVLGGARTTAPRSTRADGPRPQLCAYRSDDAEASGIAAAIRDANDRGIAWSDMAVLTRTNSQHASLISSLARLGIPARSVSSSDDKVDDPTTDGLAGASASTAQPLPDTGGEGLTRPDGDNAVTLSSFHRAKGLQWQAVWVAGLEQGLVPIAYASTDEALAEERRLLYVALTRAEKELYCSWAGERRAATGISLRRGPSPWLDALARHCAVNEVHASVAQTPFASGRQRLASTRAHHADSGGTRQHPDAAMIDLIAAARHRLARSRSPLAHPITTDPVGDATAAALREWRRKTARASGAPPFVILHDSTLELLAQRRPTTSEELEAVPGLGPVKCARFGAAICDVIRESLAHAAHTSSARAV